MREQNWRRLLTHALQEDKQRGHLRGLVGQFLALFFDLRARLREMLLEFG